MEEIEYKLKQKNSVVILQAITKLVEIIKSKKQATKDDSNSDKIIPELELLKSKCGVEDTCVCITASQGVVSLVAEGILPLGTTLSDFMVDLSTARCHTGITMAIGHLLLLDLKRNLDDKEKYVCPFSIRKPQHPLVTVLSQNSDIWPEVYNQIHSYVNHLDHKISTNSWELLKPVFFYVICEPGSKIRYTFRKQLWNLLILSNNKQKFLVFEILTWMQVNSKQKCLELSDFLIDMSRVLLKTNNEMNIALVLYLISMVYKLVKYGGDPCPCINMISQMLDHVETNHASSIILVILADTISISPAVYLKDILRLCKKLLQKKYGNALAVKSVIAAILQWLLYPSCLLSESLKLANDLILFVDNNSLNTSSTGNLYRNVYFKYIQETDELINLKTKLCLMAETWQKDEKQLATWLKSILVNPPEFISNLFNFTAGIFIRGFEKNVNLTALDIMLYFVDNNKDLAPNVLVLLLNKLVNEREPEVQLEVLRAIPKMALSKQNIPLIISTLETIKNGSGALKMLSFDLFLRLWATENRCFPYLQKVLIEATDNWETNIVKAHTLKEISIQGPELFGKEMVPHLSQVLNKSSGEKGSVASALAINGITALCDAGIIDIVSTWRTLAPKLAKDKRKSVVKSLCEFFAEYSKVRIVSTEQQETVNEAVSKLWHYVSYSEDYEIVGAALKSLSLFDLDEITLKQIPELYRQNLTLPSSYAKTPMEASRRPEDVLPYIPGECWVKMLQNMNHDALDFAGDLLIAWTRIEISNFKSGVYNSTEEDREPANYNYLPAKSIVRGLGNYIRLVTVPDSRVPYSFKVVLQALRVLSEPYSKPLPPLNWGFLYDLFHKEPEIKRACINLACKQILISGSARRLVENYINSFEPDIDKGEEIMVIFKNLTYLCKSIAPNLLRPMITNCLKICYQNFGKTERNDVNILFAGITERIKITLQEEIHEANRTLLGQIIESFVEQLDAKEEMFDIMVPCLIETPLKFIERASSPSLWWETTQEKFEKAIKIRTACAIKNTKAPFVWLNECITTAATMQSTQIVMLKHALEVFCIHRKHSTTNDWILELMGQVQEKLTSENKDVEEITFLCDVFLLAVIVFSGHDFLNCPTEMVAVTKELRFNLFPNALLNLCLERSQNITGQVMEWLYHMIEICTITPVLYKLTFYQALILLRHEKAFTASCKWMKYLSINRPVI